MLYPRYLGFIALITCLSLSACQSDKKSDVTDNTETIEKLAEVNKLQTPTRAIELIAATDLIVKPAFLSKNLPESVFMYVRVPNFWSLIGTAKGNEFDNAINAKPFFEAVQAIRLGMSENVIPEIPDEEAQLLTKVFLKHLTSPVEAIVIEGVDAAMPTPKLVVTTSADFNNTDEIQTILDVLARQTPEFEISKAITADGYAELKLANMNAQLQWDQPNSRLTLLLGLSLSLNNLSDVIKSFVPNATHQMKVFENSIDSSGQGFFTWANPRKLTSIASSMGMQKEIAPLAMMGVSSMKNFAMGIGTSDGINRFKYVTEMPVTGFRSYLPIINTSPSFNVAGKTKMLGVLGLPSRTSFVSIENTVALIAPPKDMKSYYKAKKSFKNALGFSIEDIFDFFGQDISFVSDEAGSYVAVRLNDAEKFKTTLASSVENLKLDYQQRTISGHTYHHLKIPSIYEHYLKEEMKKDLLTNKKNSNQKIKDNRLLTRLMSLPSHVYWEQEGDYLILSNIPQTLIDRHYAEAKTPANEWLKKQQRLDPNGSLMMMSVRNNGTADKMYRMHLGLINTLADFTGKPIDMFALATPREAKLPLHSSYGFKITSSETQLAFELNYESNPFEFLFAGGAYEGIAVLGILSAIAVPAYDDYRVRSQLTAGILQAEVIKSKLNEFEIEYGRYPNQYEIDDLKLNFTNPGYSITINENVGEINLKFKNIVLRSRNTLKISPPKQGISTKWRCEAQIKNKYLPASCRKKY